MKVDYGGHRLLLFYLAIHEVSILAFTEAVKVFLYLWIVLFYHVFIFVEFLVVVYFVLLKHRLHHVKNFVAVMNMI